MRRVANALVIAVAMAMAVSIGALTATIGLLWHAAAHFRQADL